MASQNYSNHIRFYVPHHFVFYPLSLALTIAAITLAFKFPDRSLEWLFMGGIMMMIIWLSFMVRQHYALTNQNRIVRLEMRLRYYELTHERFQQIENNLSFDQIAALRFASDAELPALIRQTLDENLKPNAIKKMIRAWVPDHDRV